MLEIVQAGGWLMLPIILCSVISVAICIERFWTLRVAQVAPASLLAEVKQRIKGEGVSASYIQELHTGLAPGQDTCNRH